MATRNAGSGSYFMNVTNIDTACANSCTYVSNKKTTPAIHIAGVNPSTLASHSAGK